MEIFRTKKSKSFSIIEIILASSILAMLTLFVVSTILYSQESLIKSSNRNRALYYAYESIGAINNIKSYDFSSLTDGIYGLHNNNGMWSLTPGSDTFSNFSRQIEISTVDEYTKNVITTITWTTIAQNSQNIVLRSIITNWERISSVLSIYSSVDLSSNQETIVMQYDDNSIFLVKSGANPDFIVVDKSDPQSLIELTNTNLKGKVNEMHLEDNIIYFATNDNKQNVQIYDVSDPINIISINSIDLDGNSDATSIYYNDGILYIGREEFRRNNQLYLYDVSDINNIEFLSSIKLNYDVIKFYFYDDYIYALTNDQDNDLLIINVSNLLNPVFVQSLNLINQDYTSITGFEDYLYLGDNNGVVYSFDISNRENPQLLSTYDANGSINEIRYIDEIESLLLSTSNDLNEFQIINVQDKNNPTLLYSFNAESSILTSFYDNGLYFIAGDLPTTDIIVLTE